MKYTLHWYMRILSIDVGIKNLSLCLLHQPSVSDPFAIEQWAILDLSQEQSSTCDLCKSSARWEKDGRRVCQKHSKTLPYLCPTPKQKPSFIAKQTVSALRQIAVAHHIDLPAENQKKPDLVRAIQAHFERTCFTPIQNTNGRTIDLREVAHHVRDKLNAFLEGCSAIDHVLIENQIGPQAIRMKTLQGMLMQYFVMCSASVGHIEFISALNKLKEWETCDKEAYRDRKKLGVAKCGELLQSHHPQWVSVFQSHKKKDDLADSFLQAVWYIRHKL